MTRTAGALIGRRRSSAFWGLGCPKTHHEIKDSLVIIWVVQYRAYLADMVWDSPTAIGASNADD
ncbi:MAG: hypothetical protein ABW170_14150 [Candidatus Thiodiazotropha sp. L084R]